MANVELSLGAKVDLDKSTFIKAVAEIGANKPGKSLTQRMVFKTGVTTKVQATKVCCGVTINRKPVCPARSSSPMRAPRRHRPRSLEWCSWPCLTAIPCCVDRSGRQEGPVGWHLNWFRNGYRL